MGISGNQRNSRGLRPQDLRVQIICYCWSPAPFSTYQPSRYATPRAQALLNYYILLFPLSIILLVSMLSDARKHALCKNTDTLIGTVHYARTGDYVSADHV